MTKRPTGTAPTLLLTRPRAASEAFLYALPERLRDQLDVVISPVMEIRVTGPLPAACGAAMLVFTSANGVTAFAALGGVAGGPCYVVGPATARAAHKAGFDPIEGPGDAAGLVQRIIDDAPTRPIWHLRGTHSRGNLAGYLQAAGLTADAATIYDQPLVPLSAAAQQALDREIPVLLPLFSPRSAGQVVGELAGNPPKAPLFVVAISRAVAEALGDMQPEVLRIARAPRMDEMRRELVSVAESTRLLEGGWGAQ